MKRKQTQTTMKCQYCGRTAVLRKASYVHKNAADNEFLYVCSGYPNCDAYVGVHTGTKLPLGSLADAKLRRKRMETHRVFDAIWKNGILTKKDAYRWMCDTFCLTTAQAHIGHFSHYRCDCLIDASRKVLQDNHIKIA